MSVVTLKINGVDLAIEEGSTILNAAKEAGIRIPTLCHLHGVSDVGVCRLCLVEIKGTNRLLPSCVTQVAEGMEINTHSEQLNEYRRMIIEMLFAEGNHVCAVCVANGNCELQDLAIETGMDHSRFPYRFPERQIDITHEGFGIDHNRCILCTRCVRVCDEIEGAHVWDVAYRGAAAKVITGLNQPWGNVDACTSCGKCVEACPTGSIFRKSSTVSEMTRDRSNRRLCSYRQRSRHEKHD